MVSIYGTRNLNLEFVQRLLIHDVPGIYDNTFIRSVMRSKRPDFESLAILKFATALILFSFNKKKGIGVS